MAVLTGIGIAPLTAMMVGYIGPGPGLGMIGALLGLIVTVVVAVGAVLLWPLRALLKKWRGGEEEEGDEVDPEDANEADVEPETGDTGDDPQKTDEVQSK